LSPPPSAHLHDRYNLMTSIAGLVSGFFCETR
jgi:hypothetical protein